MKETETSNYKYTQKNVIVGNKMRSVIIIDKKPGAKLGKNKTVSIPHKTVSTRKKGCSGCSRQRRA